MSNWIKTCSFVILTQSVVASTTIRIPQESTSSISTLHQVKPRNGG